MKFIYVNILFLLIQLHQSEVIIVDSYRQSIELIQKEPSNLAVLMLTSSKMVAYNYHFETYTNYSREVNGIVKTYLIDCQKLPSKDHNYLPPCKDTNKLPVITFLSPPEVEYDPFKRQLSPIENKFQGELKAEELMKATYKYIPMFATVYNNTKQFDEKFLNYTALPNKLILVTEDLKVPLWWYGLTSYFRDRLDFAVIEHSKQAEIAERYQLSGVYPDLVILLYKNGKYVQENYKSGKRFDSLRAFLTRYAAKEPVRKWKSDFEDDPTKNWDIVNQVNKVPNITNDWIMVHFKTTQHPNFLNLKQDFQALMKYYEINCLEISCQQQNLPEINFYYSGTHYHTLTNEDSIQTISENLLEAIEIRPTEERFIYKVMREELQNQKFVVLWAYDSSNNFQNLIAATISKQPRFNKQMSLIFFKDPNEEQMKTWEFKSLPTIFAFTGINIGDGKHKKIEFEDPFNYQNIFLFLNQVALMQQTEAVGKRDVEEAQTSQHFEVLCKSKCVIAVLDTKQDFDNDLDLIMKLSINKEFKSFEWLWVDGYCQQALVRWLNLKSLPTLVYYNKTKNRYLVSSEDFVSIKLMKFLSTLKKNKKQMIKLEDQLDLEDKKCSQIREFQKKQKQTEL